MKALLRRFHKALFVVVVVGTMCSFRRAEAADTNAANDLWSFDLHPYLWVAGIDLETSVPNLPPTNPGVDRFDTRISAGTMVAAQVNRGTVGLFVDFAWLRLNTEALQPGPAFSAVHLQSDFIHTTAALTYKMPLEGKFQAQILAGARIWYVANGFTASSGLLPGFDAAKDKTWVDPVIGFDGHYDLSPTWSLLVKGGIGGFGVSADIAGEAFAGVSYRFTDCCSVTLGYRYLHEEYDRSGFAFNLDTQGFLLGFDFHF